MLSRSHVLTYFHFDLLFIETRLTDINKNIDYLLLLREKFTKPSLFNTLAKIFYFFPISGFDFAVKAFDQAGIGSQLLICGFLLQYSILYSILKIN